MATTRWYLMLCVLTGTVCLARIDFQRLGASTYTDCFGGASQLNVTNAIVNNTSPHPTDQIYLNATVNNPSTTASVTVEYLIWTVNLPNPISFNQTLNGTNGVVVNSGTTTTFQSGNFQLNQFYANGSIPFQVVLNSSSNTEVACWAGDVIVLPNPYDCTLDEQSQLNITNITLSPRSPQPTDQIYLIFDIINPSTTRNVTVYYINIYLNLFSIDLYGQWDGLVISAGTTYGPLKITSFYKLNQIYSSGWISYELEISNYTAQLACWMGSVNIIAPSNPTDCLGGSQLNVSAVSLYPNWPVWRQPFYVAFEVENNSQANVTFDEILWTLTFNTGLSFAIHQIMSSAVTVVAGGNQQLNGTSITMNGTWDSWYEYKFKFTNKANQIACWEGYEIVIPLPPNPSDCFLGYSLLSVSSFTLNSSSPQTNDPVNITFTIENQSGGNVTFTDLTWLLSVNGSSNILYTLEIHSSHTLVIGESLIMSESNVTQNQNVSAGAYQYAFIFYNPSGEIACWEGIFIIPSPNNPSPNPSPNRPSSSSSYIYFLGLVGLSIMLTS